MKGKMHKQKRRDLASKQKCRNFSAGAFVQANKYPPAFLNFFLLTEQAEQEYPTKQ